MRTPFVMGNWKLNGSKPQTLNLITQLKINLASVRNCSIAIAPPVTYLDYAGELLQDSNIALGAQNADVAFSGAHTGDISPVMLKELKVIFVIVGHSERRQYHKESDAFIAKKFAVIKEQRLTPVLCIGETEKENEEGLTETVCARQINAIFHELGVNAFNDAIIAYEPIWAIGTGKSATPEQAQKVHQFIRQHISQQNAESGAKLIIQYGGSVNSNNAAELFAQPDIDGALVGGASLKADAFSEIVFAAQQAKQKT